MENIAPQKYSPFNQTEYKTAYFTPVSFPLRMTPYHDGMYPYLFAVAKQKKTDIAARPYIFDAILMYQTVYNIVCLKTTIIK